MTEQQADSEQPSGESVPVSRRAVIGGAAAAGGAALIGAGSRRPTDAQSRLIDTALAASTSASLSDVKHVVVLMQENRSFDSYFGTLSGVRGFSDPAVPRHTVNGVSYPVFDQFGYQPGAGVDPNGYMQPFHLASNPPLEDGQTTNDIDHSWAGQHQSWNNGAMDSFIASHLAHDGATNGPVTMGYYTRQEISTYGGTLYA